MTESSDNPSSASTTGWRRRHWLGTAVAAAAVLGGAGLAWRTNRARQGDRVIDPAFWQLVFSKPDGVMLHMDELRNKPLLLNFWATWCPPCVQEMPLLSGFHDLNAAKGWKVLGIAVDSIDPVQRFLLQNPVTFPVVLASASGIELSRTLGNLVGVLPFTLVLGSDGVVRHRKIGALTTDELKAWANPSDV